MKKLILLGSLILVCMTIHAQPEYEVGIRAGVNYSTQFTSAVYSDVETSWKQGFHIGIFGNLYYSEKMAGQLEFLFSEKGSQWNDPSYSGDEVVNYIDMGLAARYQALDLLSIHAGPQFSFLTRAWRMSDEGVAYSVTEYWDEVDVGLMLGLELNLPIRLNIALRYIEGFLRASDSRYYPDPWQNRVFQLSLSYAIWGE